MYDSSFQRPNTLHYVVTLDDSIVYGNHFLATSSIADTCLGIIHTFIMSYSITNAQHDNTRSILRRMMGMWYNHYCVNDGSTFGIYFFHPNSVASKMISLCLTGLDRANHIPDVSSPAGLLELVMVGTLLEVAEVIDRRHYTGKVDDLEEEEIAFARLRYRRFCTWFSNQFITVIGAAWVHPSYIFQRSLLQFSACLIYYKRERQAQSADVPTTSGCTARKMEQMIHEHLATHWPELTRSMAALLDDEVEMGMDVSSFRWTGPMFIIAKRNSEVATELTQSAMEKRDFVREPIYI
jgi:hypothetical protein